MSAVRMTGLRKEDSSFIQRKLLIPISTQIISNLWKIWRLLYRLKHLSDVEKYK